MSKYEDSASTAEVQGINQMESAQQETPNNRKVRLRARRVFGSYQELERVYQLLDDALNHTGGWRNLVIGAENHDF